MSETSDGREAIGPHMSEDEDPDSPARASFFSRLFRRDGEDEEPLSEPTEESRAALAGAREMLLNLRKMRRMRVDDVSVPRADIVAVGEDATLEEVVAVFQSSTVSRLPVYSDTLDQPLGLVHLKDLALRYGFGAPGTGFDLRGILRPLLFKVGNYDFSAVAFCILQFADLGLRQRQ